MTAELLTTREVADKLKIDPTTVTYYIRKGQLKAIKLGRGYRVSQEELERFLESKKE